MMEYFGRKFNKYRINNYDIENKIVDFQTFQSLNYSFVTHSISASDIVVNEYLMNNESMKPIVKFLQTNQIDSQPSVFLDSINNHNDLKPMMLKRRTRFTRTEVVFNLEDIYMLFGRRSVADMFFRHRPQSAFQNVKNGIKNMFPLEPHSGIEQEGVLTQLLYVNLVRSDMINTYIKESVTHVLDSIFESQQLKNRNISTMFMFTNTGIFPHSVIYNDNLSNNSVIPMTINTWLTNTL